MPNDALSDALAQLAQAVSPNALFARWADRDPEAAGADPDAAWRDELHALSADLVRALRSLAASARGPDWPEQAWDSYEYIDYERAEWRVTVPFVALSLADSPVVPVAAAERILGFPDDDAPPVEAWERRPRGRYYRRYWASNKRFLGLVADIAARFPHDGGEALAKELKNRLRWLPRSERATVQLHLAALGLSEDDPVPVARQVLADASEFDLGARGELVLETLQRVEDLPAAQRAELLVETAGVARRTTAFVASNPYAACIEALSRAEVHTVEELVELVVRARTLKSHDWRGWERALNAAGRSVTHLAASYGPSVVEEAVGWLSRWRYTFPGLEAMLRLSGARGLEPPGRVDLARQALELARRLPPSAEAVRVEVGAARLLDGAGAEGGVHELRTMGLRLRSMPVDRAQQLGLRLVSTALAGLDRGDGTLYAEAQSLATGLRAARATWLTRLALAAAPAATETQRQVHLLEAKRAGRRWLVKRPPFDALVPLATHLASRPRTAGEDPALRRLVELAHAVADGELTGRQFASEFMALGPLLADPAAVQAVAATVMGLGETWWRLMLLALVADGTAAWLAGLPCPEPAARPD